MKAICIHDCQFRGVLVKADTILEVTPEEAATEPCHSSFRPLEGEVRPKEDKPDKNGMTLQNYRDRLDAMNVPYHPTDDIDALRKIFERATDLSSRKRTKPQ